VIKAKEPQNLVGIFDASGITLWVNVDAELNLS